MRILFLSTWFPHPPDNGSKLRVYYLIRSLSRSHHVTVVAYQPDDVVSRTHTNSVIFDDVSVLGVPESPFRYVNLPQIVKYLSPIPLVVWPSKFMRSAVSNVALTRHWDAVVAFQTPVARYALIPKTTARVLDIDNSLSFFGSERLAAQVTRLSRFKAHISWVKSFRYESRLTRQFHACTVVSPLEVDFIRKMVDGTSCRVEMNGNGVDCEHNRPGLATPRADALIYNGSLTYSANYDAMQWFLSQIYPPIRQAVPDVTLAITGSTQGVDTAGLALDDTVTLTGYVDDIRRPVAEASVCVVPIRQGGGTRLKILEAMALGTPVVATSKGAEGLNVVDGEHLLLADEPSVFAAAVLRLVRDEELREHLRKNARQLVEQHYDWNAIGQRFVALIEETVDTNRALPSVLA